MDRVEAGEMHIFYCNNLFAHPQTGGEIFYSKILDHLHSRLDVDLILPTKDDLHYLNRPDGCIGINQHFFLRFLRLPKRTIIIESEQCGYGFFLANWLVRLVRRDLKTLVSVHQLPMPSSQDTLRHRLVRDGMLSSLFRSASAVTVNSRYIGCEAASRYGVRQNRIHIVNPAGQKFDSTARETVVKGDSSLQLLCVANVRPHKGQKVLIEALGRLQPYPVRLMLVGVTKDEGYEHELRRLMAGLGLLKRVWLAGPLKGENLARAYAGADVFVLPALYEPYGMVIQEAMSFGLPVVASDIGGIPEQFTDGIEGFLVSPGDSKALAGALGKLIADPELRAQMRTAARKRAAELPTWDKVYNQFGQLLTMLDKGASEAQIIGN